MHTALLQTCMPHRCCNVVIHEICSCLARLVPFAALADTFILKNSMVQKLRYTQVYNNEPGMLQEPLLRQCARLGA